MSTDALGVKTDGEIVENQAVKDIDVRKFADNDAKAEDVGFDTQLKLLTQLSTKYLLNVLNLVQFKTV